MNSQTPHTARIAHITPSGLPDESIVAAAMAARQIMCAAARDERIGRAAVVNGAIISRNACALWIGEDPERGMIAPIKSNRGGRHAKESVKRGFRFTIEGREGVFKLNPFRKIS